MKRSVCAFLSVFLFWGTIFFFAKTGAAANQNPKPAVNNGEYYDLLIEGVDRRSYQATGRSDVIMIVHCEPDRITLFSMPRDSLVMVRGSLDKVNHAYAYGGIRLSKST